MGIIAITIIFLCICVDNMVSANMSSLKMKTEVKNIFSIKLAVFFSAFNALLFGLGYLISAIIFNDWIYLAQNWVAFAFILLLGIKFMLESVEKSPSFTEEEVNNNRKLVKVSALFGLNAFLVGFAADTMQKGWFPQILILMAITFGFTLLGFHLGRQNSKIITSKRFEFIAGLLLVIMALRLIII